MDWLKWWGYPFFVTGALSSLMALIGASAFGSIVQRMLQNQGAGLMPPILFSALRETISAMTSQILKPVVIEGLILGILGLGMIVVAMYLAKKESS